MSYLRRPGPLAGLWRVDRLASEAERAEERAGMRASFLRLDGNLRSGIAIEANGLPDRHVAAGARMIDDVESVVTGRPEPPIFEQRCRRRMDDCAAQQFRRVNKAFKRDPF